MREPKLETSRHAPVRIAFILAGGKARRMGGADKALIELGGVRLIDRVIERLAPQVDELLIAGPHDYQTGLETVADRRDGPAGPAAGLWAAAHWMAERRADAKGFATAPVDGPFLPPDLYARLAAERVCAVASDGARDHPTFAYWRVDRLTTALAGLPAGKGAALRELAEQRHALRVFFADSCGLMNINTPADVARAERLLANDPAKL